MKTRRVIVSYIFPLFFLSHSLSFFPSFSYFLSFFVLFSTSFFLSFLLSFLSLIYMHARLYTIALLNREVHFLASNLSLHIFLYEYISRLHIFCFDKCLDLNFRSSFFLINIHKCPNVLTSKRFSFLSVM